MDLSEVKRDRALLLAELGITQPTTNGRYRCPFHDDHTPSLSVFTHEGVWLWKCQRGCGSGTVIDARARAKHISASDACRELSAELGIPIRRDEDYQEPVIDRERAERLVAAAHKRLMDDWDLQSQYLDARRGISLEVAEQYRLGLLPGLTFREWGGWKFLCPWILPITSASGELLGVKLHNEITSSPKQPKCMWAPFGTQPEKKPVHRTLTLWPPPERWPGAEELLIAPGELKALALISAGFAATASTAGESSGLPRRLVDRVAACKPGRIVLTYDDDPTGRQWRDKLGECLERRQIQVLAVSYGSLTPEQLAQAQVAGVLAAWDAGLPKDLAKWAEVCDEEEHRRLQIAPPEWGARGQALLDWFAGNMERLPSQPFRLTRHESISDAGRFYENISGKISGGPGGAEKRGLLCTLEKLYAMVEGVPFEQQD